MALLPIPQPKPDPFLGNARALTGEAPIQEMMRLTRVHGPIFKLALPTGDLVVVSSQALVHELCDPSRFTKALHPVLRQVRAFGGDGLFTAESDEPNWGKAHRILMPAFGPFGVRKMFDGMVDIAQQLMLRWERFGPEARFDVPDQMTRLTLDTIALCGFDYRFNSFYQEEMHPFIDAMVGGLKAASHRAKRPAVANTILRAQERDFRANSALMHEVADRLIRERRRDIDASKDDLLARMLEATDPVTGERLSDENIRYQMVTFLIAGHETTSGLLSFALYLMLEHPHAWEEARREVDEVVGSAPPTVEKLSRLRYLEQILMETLRLWPTAPAFGLKANEETVIGGAYRISPADNVLVLVPMLHRDVAVWGDDVEEFKPERFEREREAALPPDAWKPFGTGARACIGRPFAMQEAMLVLTLLLQRFELELADPGYTLEVKETLTLKPHELFVHARRRRDLPAAREEDVARDDTSQAPQEEVPRLSDLARRPLTVLYGSNSGSSEAFAQRIARDAGARGFAATLATLDSATGQLPREGAVVIVTASFEGQPADNARKFVAWLDACDEDALEGVTFTVFGCGNRQWARTYQAVPQHIDAQLEACGAQRFMARGEADAAADFFGDFERWYAGLWPALAEVFQDALIAEAQPSRATLEVERLGSGRATLLRQQDLDTGLITENRSLVDRSHPGARDKRHIELELPAGMTYRAGDYLAVLPRNPLISVERVMRRFGFSPDAEVVLRGESDALTPLPLGHPIAVQELLSSYVELAAPATLQQVEALLELTRCPPERRELERLASPEVYAEQVLAQRVSVLDLVERFAACEIEFASYLEMLPPLRPRQYSISSSPLWHERRATLTLSVLDQPAKSGQGRFQGVASSYLAQLPQGARLPVAVRPGNARFRPPADLSVPLVLICAGTGLAPFRGFLQERAIMAAAGREMAEALLFFGCDHPEVDYLYREELEAWEAQGVVTLRPAFSESTEDEVRFVQHRVWERREEIAAAFRRGATVFVCGDGERMAPAVRQTLLRIYQEATACSEEEATRWANTIEREHGRYVEDVFA